MYVHSVLQLIVVTMVLHLRDLAILATQIFGSACIFCDARLQSFLFFNQVGIQIFGPSYFQLSWVLHIYIYLLFSTVMDILYFYNILVSFSVYEGLRLASIAAPVFVVLCQHNYCYYLYILKQHWYAHLKGFVIFFILILLVS